MGIPKRSKVRVYPTADGWTAEVVGPSGSVHVSSWGSTESQARQNLDDLLETRRQARVAKTKNAPDDVPSKFRLRKSRKIHGAPGVIFAAKKNIEAAKEKRARKK